VISVYLEVRTDLNICFNLLFRNRRATPSSSDSSSNDKTSYCFEELLMMMWLLWMSFTRSNIDALCGFGLCRLECLNRRFWHDPDSRNLPSVHIFVHFHIFFPSMVISDGTVCQLFDIHVHRSWSFSFNTKPEDPPLD
jgi:hypothetical protein